MGLALITGEARGAGAGEVGGQWGSGAMGAWGCGEQGLAAATVLAELGISAGVRKLASLTQKSRRTPGGRGTFQASGPSSFSLSSVSPGSTPMKHTHWQVPCPRDSLRQVPPFSQGSGDPPHRSSGEETGR